MLFWSIILKAHVRSRFLLILLYNYCQFTVVSDYFEHNFFIFPQKIFLNKWSNLQSQKQVIKKAPVLSMIISFLVNTLSSNQLKVLWSWKKNMIVCQGNLSHEDSNYCGAPVVVGDSFQQCAPQFPSWDQETHLRVPWNSTGSWGMTEMAVRNVCSPNFRMSIPSTSIVPLSTSTNRNRALTKELFPALGQKEKNIKLLGMN